jgi:hypothetical protein
MESSSRSENKSENDPVMDLFPDEDNDERSSYTLTINPSFRGLALNVYFLFV